MNHRKTLSVGGCGTDDPRIDAWLCVATEVCFAHAMD